MRVPTQAGVNAGTGDCIVTQATGQWLTISKSLCRLLMRSLRSDLWGERLEEHGDQLAVRKASWETMYLKGATKHQPFPRNKLYMRGNTHLYVRLIWTNTAGLRILWRVSGRTVRHRKCVRGKVERERDKKSEQRREGGGNDLRDYWPKGMSCQDSPAHKHSIVRLVIASHFPSRPEYGRRLMI